MRTGTVVALLLLVIGAVLFAPQLGRKDAPPAPTPPAPTPPETEPAVPLYDLRPLLALVPDGDLVETYPHEAWRRLDDLRTGERKHATAEEYERVVGWLTTAREHARRLQEDRRYREEWQVRMNFRLHPFLKSYRFVVVSRPPWLVWLQKGEGAEREAGRLAGWLGTLATEMERRIATPCGFPAFVDLPRPAERILTMLVFRNEKTYREYLQWTGRFSGKYDDGWYTGKLEGGISFLRPGEDPDEWASRLLLPAAFQAIQVLVHHGIELEGGTGEEATWRERGMRGDLLWARQGLARVLSAAKVRDDGSLELFTIRPDYLRILREGRDRLELGTILRVRTPRDLLKKAFDVGLSRRAADAIAFDALARSWAFVHFLWHHPDAAVRGRFLAYLKGELRGRTGYRYWARIQGSTGRAGTPLETEFEAWLDEVCEQGGGK